MSTQPKWTEPRPCKACKHFGRWVVPNSAVWCLHGQIVHALPATGCAYWRAGGMLPANALEPQNEKAP